MAGSHTWLLDGILSVGEDVLQSVNKEIFLCCCRLVHGVAAVSVSAFTEPGYYGKLRHTTQAPDARSRWRAYWEKHESSRSRLGEVCRRHVSELESRVPRRNTSGRRTDGGSTTEGWTEEGESDASLGPWHDALTRSWPSNDSDAASLLGGADDDGARADDDNSADEETGPLTARKGGPFRRKHLQNLDAPGTTKGRHGAHRRRGVLEELPLHVDVAIASAFSAARQWAATPRARHAAMAAAEGPGSPKRAAARHHHRRRRRAGGANADAPAPAPMTNEEVASAAAIASPSPRSSFEDMPAPPTTAPPSTSDETSAEHLIRRHGYPHRAYSVQTIDGYVLHLDRIPRPRSRRKVYLQAGLFDDAVGWVSCGGARSLALCLYDEGFDVYLGNLRSSPPHHHVDPALDGGKGSYWDYDLTEHCLFDVSAIVDAIAAHADVELGGRGGCAAVTLQGIGHSLGAAALLAHVGYFEWRRLHNEQDGTAAGAGPPSSLLPVTPRLGFHGVIALAPAGFHHHATPRAASWFMQLDRVVPRAVLPRVLHLPGNAARSLWHRFVQDLQDLPALGRMFNATASFFLGADPSDWARTLLKPHYSEESMPAVSMRTILWLVECWRARSFMLWDGGKQYNCRMYGTAAPFCVADLGYQAIVARGRVVVSVASGSDDGLCSSQNAAEHIRALRVARRAVLRESDAASEDDEYKVFVGLCHNSFTLDPSDDLVRWVLGRLDVVRR